MLLFNDYGNSLGVVGYYKLMDNFHLQVTPLEFAYHSKDPIALSCLVKKSMPSGGLPERRQLRPDTDLTYGRATFKEAATFAINREMELRGTKISLNFFNKNSLIGSKDLQVASLPAQPHAVLELNLDNCSDPKAKLTLEIQRKETEARHAKKENSRPHEMGILRTEGQLWEEAITKSRINPSIPTAYQISRRNYKQAEVSYHEEKKSDGSKSSGKKGSYLQRGALHAKPAKQPINEERPRQSPMPRKQTPEPIRIGAKQEAPKATQPVHKYAISKVSSRANHSHTTSNHTEPTLPYEQPALEPERLKVRPYREDENVEHVNREGIRSLEEEKKQKYRTITDKLQLIHDKIAHSKERVDHSENSSECEMSHNHRSYFEERQGSLPAAAVNSFTHLSAASIDTPTILKESEESSSQKDQQQRPKQTPITSSNVEKQFQNIKSVKTKSPDNSPPSEKTVSFQTIPENPLPPSAAHPLKDTSTDTILNEREEEQIELQLCRQEIKRLKSDLSSALRLVGERDSTIKELQEELLHFQSLLQEKQGLLGRLNHEYELRFEEVYSLKERVAAFEDERNRINEERKLSEQQTPTDSGQPSKLAQSLSGELLRAKKRMLQSQSQLKFKENENRCLTLQIDNVRREKRNLEQEIQVLVSRDKNEMTRQASLARIEQISTNSLATHAKRENEALRNEVKLLQQKLESLNGLFQSLLSPEEKAKAMGNLQPTRDSSQVQRRAKLLQEKCVLLEEELKNKKNQLAEVINIIWKHEDGDIMNDVLTLISTQSPPA